MTTDRELDVEEVKGQPLTTADVHAPLERRHRASLAVVRSVIGDAEEQLHTLRKLSLGLPVRVNERLADGSVIEHVLTPTIREVERAAEYLVDRRHGRIFGEVKGDPGDMHAAPDAIPAGLRVRLREVAREWVFERESLGEKGDSPMDEEAQRVLMMDSTYTPTWPAPGEARPPVGAFAPASSEGAPARGAPAAGGGRAPEDPRPLAWGPPTDMRVTSLPAPLEPEILPGGVKSAVDILARTTTMGPCDNCGHIHAGGDCDVWMGLLGRSCGCAEYVDTAESLRAPNGDPVYIPDRCTEAALEVPVAQQRRYAECVAAESAEKCLLCGHRAEEHFATASSTGCVECKCREFKAGGGRDGVTEEGVGLGGDPGAARAQGSVPESVGARVVAGAAVRGGGAAESEVVSGAAAGSGEGDDRDRGAAGGEGRVAGDAGDARGGAGAGAGSKEPGGVRPGDASADRGDGEAGPEVVDADAAFAAFLAKKTAKKKGK